MSSNPFVWPVLTTHVSSGRTELESVHQTPSGAVEAAYDIAREGKQGAWDELDYDRRLTLKSGDLKILVEKEELKR